MRIENSMPFLKKQSTRRVYLDHAATTYLDTRVADAMTPYLRDTFGNASGLYKIGRDAQAALTAARKTVTDILHTQADTIIFTSGGTESDNMAVLGIARKYKEQGKHIVTTKIEHHAVLHPCEKLEREDFEVTYLEPDEFGFISAKQVREALREDTILVSIMYANNEIGTILPIADIGREILKYRKKHNTVFPYFHTDACQAAGVMTLDVEKLHVDLMTINGSKIYGPKGTGILYKRRAVDIEPLMYGGSQEMHLRPGTEDIAGIVGFAKALELAQENAEEENDRLTKLRNYFWDEIKNKIENVALNGPLLNSEELTRLPNNLHVTFENVEGESLVLYLDEKSIQCATGSACTSDTITPSHVMLAIGKSEKDASASVRFTLGKVTTKDDIDYVMKHLPELVHQQRKVSAMIR